MSGPAAPARILPGSNFDDHRDHLHWIPAEITEMIHKGVVNSDKFVITSKDARAGMLGGVPSKTAQNGPSRPSESTFSFSTVYSSAISNKTTFDEYRSIAQKYIINDLECVFINIENLQFANARKFIKTLQKAGKLQDFLLLPDQYGTPNRRAPKRRMFFHHSITKKFSGDSSKVEKWSKEIEALKQGEAVFYMQHEFRKFCDGDAIRLCVSQLSSAGTLPHPLQRNVIGSQLRRCVSGFEQRKMAENNVMAQRRAQAHQNLAVFREQNRREAEEQYLREMRDEREEVSIESSNGVEDIEMEVDGDEVHGDDMHAGEDMNMEATGQASWGSLVSRNNPYLCFELYLLTLPLIALSSVEEG